MEILVSCPELPSRLRLFYYTGYSLFWQGGDLLIRLQTAQDFYLLRITDEISDTQRADIDQLLEKHRRQEFLPR